MKFRATILLGAAAFAFSACGTATNVAVNTNTAANKSNTAVVTNTATNAANTSAMNTNTAMSNTSSSAATGDTIRIDEAGIQVTAPKGFKISKDGETTNLISPDDAFEVYFHVPADGDYDKALADVGTEIDDYIKDVKVSGNGEDGSFDGMPAKMFSGTGNDKESGEAVNWELIIVKAPKKPVLIVSYADKGSYEKYEAQINEIGKSIKKQ